MSWRELSLRLEDETGYDSIPTIEMSDPPYRCVFPGCTVTRVDSKKMWLHYHFTKKHGLSFGVAKPELIPASEEAPTP